MKSEKKLFVLLGIFFILTVIHAASAINIKYVQCPTTEHTIINETIVCTQPQLNTTQEKTNDIRTSIENGIKQAFPENPTIGLITMMLVAIALIYLIMKWVT